MHDGLEILGHLPVQLAQPDRLRVRHLLDQAVPLLLVERRPERQHLVQRQTERIDIAAGICLPLESFRRHVTQRAEDVAGVRQVLLVVRLGQTEIGTHTVPCESRSRFEGLMSRW